MSYNKRRRSSYLTCVLITLVTLAAYAQQKKDFKIYYDEASQLPFIDTVNIRVHPLPASWDTVQYIFFRKKNWQAEELYVVDSLLAYANTTKSKPQQAVLHYNAAFAYRDFDDIVADSLLFRCYDLFKQTNDVDGQIFALHHAMKKKVIQGVNDSLEAENIKREFEFLFLLGEQSMWPVSQVILLDSRFDYELVQNEILEVVLLDSIANVIEQYNFINKANIGNLYFHLTKQYYYCNKKEKSLAAAKKALQCLDSNDYERPAFNYNVGWLFADMHQYDSALYYLHLAHNKYPQNNVIYFLSHYADVTYALAAVHRALGNHDSAYHYLDKSLHHVLKQGDLSLSENRLYAEKRYQASVLKTELAQAIAVLAQQAAWRQVYRVFILGISLILLGLVFLLYRRRKLLKATNALAKNRERLLQIISHDLTDSLSALISHVRYYDEAKKTLPEEATKDLEKHFIGSATVIQTILMNLKSWGKHITNQSERTKQTVNVGRLLTQTITTYREYAAARHINIQTNCTVDEVETYPADVATVLRNVVNNAIKHGVIHTEIYITCRKEPQGVVLTIANTCLPEDKAVLQKIIPDVQAHNYSSTQGSLGMELITTSLYHLNAKIAMQPSEDDLVFLQIELPTT